MSIQNLRRSFTLSRIGEGAFSMLSSIENIFLGRSQMRQKLELDGGMPLEIFSDRLNTWFGTDTQFG